MYNTARMRVEELGDAPANPHTLHAYIERTKVSFAVCVLALERRVDGGEGYLA